MDSSDNNLNALLDSDMDIDYLGLQGELFDIYTPQNAHDSMSNQSRSPFMTSFSPLVNVPHTPNDGSSPAHPTNAMGGLSEQYQFDPTAPNRFSPSEAPPVKKHRPVVTYEMSSVNRDCALHLAARTLEHLQMLFQFLEVVDHQEEFEESIDFLHNASKSIRSFIFSLLPSYIDQSPVTNLSSATLQDFSLGEHIGVGTFGTVRLCRYVHTGETFCMKILNKEKNIRLKQQQHILNEKSILMSCDHPFIVKLYTTFQDSENLYFVMEYVAGGELFNVVNHLGRLDPSAAKFYAAEIVLILEYLHFKGIAYRDLKPENILIDRKGHIKLADFGFAKQIVDKTWTMCGTPEYIAPEIILAKGHGKAVDFWSLGILIYEMLAGHPPFEGDTTFDVFQKILSEKYVIPESFTEFEKDIVVQLLKSDITQRLGCMRLGVQEIKTHPWFRDIDWEMLLNRQLPGPLRPLSNGNGNDQMDTHFRDF